MSMQTHDPGQKMTFTQLVTDVMRYLRRSSPKQSKAQQRQQNTALKQVINSGARTTFADPPRPSMTIDDLVRAIHPSDADYILSTWTRPTKEMFDGVEGRQKIQVLEEYLDRECRRVLDLRRNNTTE